MGPRRPLLNLDDAIERSIEGSASGSYWPRLHKSAFDHLDWINPFR
ncbi:hypothetical protein C7S13_7200 [Burkholderia cepacia]|nr:hypothetical protein [Burkholderia cepacia]